MKLLINFIFAFFLINVNIFATSLQDSVKETIISNPEISAEIRNQEAYQEYVDEKKSNFYPTIDLTTYYENNETKIDPESSTPTKETIRKDGWNAQLKLEQSLYDGGYTTSLVREYKHIRNSNKFRSNHNIETIIQQTINAYLGLSKNQELLKLSEEMIKKHEKNLKIAKEKEEISGEILETYQVSSKLNFTTDKFLEQEDDFEVQKASYKRYVGKNPSTFFCRPIIKREAIPNTLEKAIEYAVINNEKILEQVEKIEEAKQKISKVNASFLPTLKLIAQGTLNDDLDLSENGRQDEYLARLQLSWNFYNGGSDYNVGQREMKFLQEAKKTLDSITDEIVEAVKVSYLRYEKNEKRVDVLKKYSLDNKNIVEVYKKEFDAGTRTFIDILNAESEYYQANTTLITREYSLFTDYYELLLNLSLLSDTILLQDKQVCVKKDIERATAQTSEDKEIDNLLNDLLSE